MFVLLICLGTFMSCFAEFSVLTQSGPVSAPLGSSAILPCHIFPTLNAKTFNVRWQRKDDYNNPVLLYSDLVVQENAGDAQYRGRASLIGQVELGNVSLKLDNVTLADGGEYVCFVKSIEWYDRNSTNLIITALGTPSLLSVTDAGDQVNVTCSSGGWSPKPNLVWRDKQGRELTDSHIHYTTDSDGFVSVRSWQILSPSESEWVSCSVGVSDQEMREGRVLPHKGFWREAFISTLAGSLIVLTTLTVFLLLVVKGLLMTPTSKKQSRTTDESPESKHLFSDSQSKSPSQENTDADTSMQRGGDFESMRRSRVSLQLNQKTNASLEVHENSVRVKDNKYLYPYVLSANTPQIRNGTYYWEVKIPETKKSWCVGVAYNNEQETLCYDEEVGLFLNFDPQSKIRSDVSVQQLGVFLHGKLKSLSFYNVGSQAHLHTFNNLPSNTTYMPLFSPGIKDSCDLTLC